MPQEQVGLHLSRSQSVPVHRAAVHRAAVLGRPIEHSLSPVLHRAAYAALGLSGWTYERRDCGAEDIAPLLATADAQWAGFSVTMPGKRAALAAADHVADTAAAVGAANTLIHEADGSWSAHNTDVAGIRAALGQPVDGPVVLLGAGGTAQAAVVALAALGLTDVTVCVRDPARTADLLATAERVGLRVRLAALAANTDELTEAGTVISTLPGTAADPMATTAWRAGVRLLDAVYAPWPTRLAAAVASAGGAVIGGSEILLHQAAAQVQLMTGHEAGVAAMRSALNDAIAARDTAGPGPAVPGTAVPGTAVPGTAVPGTAVLGTAVPGEQT